MIANQNGAIASPATVKTRMAWSTAELCRTAAITPSGMPSSVAKRRAEKVSSMVAGSRRNRSWVTGRLV